MHAYTVFLLPIPQTRYHNFYHAMDVVQFYYKMVSTMVHKDVFRPIDVFATLIAALAHDVGHPGVCSVQCAVCSVQCAVCSVQCAVCGVQCAVCSVRCVVCVRCAVCALVDDATQSAPFRPDYCCCACSRSTSLHPPAI